MQQNIFQLKHALLVQKRLDGNIKRAEKREKERKKGVK